MEIETPEQVVFSYTIAGVGSRAAAALIDHAILLLLSIALWVGLGYLSSALGGARVAGGNWLFALAILAQFAMFWGYFVLFEALWDGQTPGKRRVGIRVVQDGGYSVSFAASATRNLARILDMQPGVTYGVALVSAAISRSGKRLGDMLAGTLVVHERVTQSPAMRARPAAPDEMAVTSLTAALTEQEYELLDRFLARRSALEPERRRTLAEQLVARFGEHLPAEGATPMAKLIALHEREQGSRRQGVATRGNAGAAREQHAIVARSLPRWTDFSIRLADAQRRGLRNMSEEEVSDFVARYREVATDFARLKTASQGREPESLFYVSRLLGAGHNLLYRRRPLLFANALHFMTVTVPTEIRRSAVPILIAALSLFGPMAVTYAAVLANPSLTAELLPPMMLDRAEEGVERAKTGGGYITIEDFERPVMATRIIANNVQVTFAAFAFGIMAGLGTIFLLATNGISIGAGFGLYSTKGILHLIGGFVLPHGVFELSAICIAGGGGLLIGSAFLIPGNRTRREALVLRGRRAVRLIAASTLFLLVAGLIEGLVSPRDDVPMPVRVAIAMVSAVAITLYIAFGRGTDGAAEEFAYSDARALISR